MTRFIKVDLCLQPSNGSFLELDLEEYHFCQQMIRENENKAIY